MIDAEQFWSKVEKVPFETCWLWGGAITSGGYGSVRAGGRTCRAHRVAYELTNGPIPEGMEVDHLCRVRSCVRPDHLEAVTHRENVLRGVSVVAACAKKEACVRGHPFPRPSDGVRRYCHPCQRLRERAEYWRDPQAAIAESKARREKRRVREKGAEE